MYSGGSQLPKVHVAMLELGEAGQLGVPAPPNELKPNNCTGQRHRFEISAFLGTAPNLWPGARWGFGLDCLRVAFVGHAS
jgi:hypothetical protein